MRPGQSAFAPVLFAVGAILLTAPGASSQTATTVPNALQGFSQNRDKPVHIKAQSFELREKDRKATFTGNVHVTQGDTVIRCKSLVVTYEQDAMPGAAKAVQPGPGGRQQISKLEALGGVIVTQKDQTATGDSGFFDLRSNTVTLIGNVVVSQGQSIMRGERLVVDLNSGVSRVESGKSRGQVEMLIPQSSSNSAQPGTLPKPNLLRPAQQN